MKPFIDVLVENFLVASTSTKKSSTSDQVVSAQRPQCGRYRTLWAHRLHLNPNSSLLNWQEVYLASGSDYLETPNYEAQYSSSPGVLHGIKKMVDNFNKKCPTAKDRPKIATENDPISIIALDDTTGLRSLRKTALRIKKGLGRAQSTGE